MSDSHAETVILRKDKVAELIGLSGLGAMGSGIAATLLRAGNELTVFDLDASRMTVALDAGGVAARDAAELAECCDVTRSSNHAKLVSRFAGERRRGRCRDRHALRFCRRWPRRRGPATTEGLANSSRRSRVG